MEALLRLLPAPQPIYIRYGVSILLVLLTFTLRLGMENRAGPYGFVLFIPAIMVASLMFDRILIALSTDSVVGGLANACRDAAISSRPLPTQSNRAWLATRRFQSNLRL
jgi:hypothetical protein